MVPCMLVVLIGILSSKTDSDSSLAADSHWHRPLGDLIRI